MSSTYTQNSNPFYGVPTDEEVRWVWIPMPVKVSSASPNSTSNFSLPNILYSNFVPAYLPSGTATWPPVPAWDRGTDSLYYPSQFQGNAIPNGSSLGLDLQLDPQVMVSGALMPSVPIALPDLDNDEALLSTDFSFADCTWACPSPESSDGSPGTATTHSPTGTPPAHTFGMPPNHSPLSLHICPELDCFDTFTQLADLTKHTRKQHPKPPSPLHFHCPLCSKSHANQRALERHLWAKHPDHAERTGVKSVKVKCSRCDYISRVDNVKRHERTRHGNGERKG